MRQGRRDFFHASFNDAHPAGHLLWHLMDPAHPRHDPGLDPRLGRSLVDIYSEIDEAIATMLRIAGDDASVFVLSPHGIGPNPAPGNALEVVLERAGYLVRGSTPDEAADPRTLWLRRAYKLGRLLTPPALRPTVARLVPRPGGVIAFTYEDVDWRSTRAFELHGDGTSFVRVNLAGREPNGTVAPGDAYNALCEELAAFIEKIEYADTGAPAAVRISRTTEPVDEPVRSSLPDLCVEWGARRIGRLRHPDVGVFDVGGDDPRTGHHRSSGFLVGAGPGIEPSDALELAQHEASLLDVAPTMLARLGVDAPREMSGDPIAAFTP
jgi:predicted AlkP superfamily phosphohydrolase/phosphomutase